MMASAAPEGPRRPATTGGGPELVAYRVAPAPGLELVPAPRARPWMDATAQRFANRCLPLLIANQGGWFVLNRDPLRVTWDGGDEIGALHLDPPGASHAATSHFGHGILTWHIPYVFQTPPGYNLLARGPSNWPKDGAAALEGVIESDWSVATFTMNWKITAVDRPVLFDADEPICMVVPQHRGDLERFMPVVRDIDADPDVAEAYRRWNASRARFNADLQVPGSDAVKQAWQKHYFRGATPDGTKAAEHQTRLQLRPFDDGG